MNRFSAFPSRETGQAMTEFLVIAAAVLIPLFFGIYYLAKYSDIKHATNQASRYAAFERSWDPDSQHKSDAVIQDEVRVRFFSHKRDIHYQDASSQIGDAEIQLWRQANQQLLLEDYDDVNLTQASGGSLGGGIQTQISNFGATLLGQKNHGITNSTVSMDVAEVGHFAAVDPRRLALTITSTTAIGAGSWSSSGSLSGPNSTCSSVANASLGSYLERVYRFVKPVMDVLESSDLQIGLIRPDLVPEGSLIRNGNTSSPQNVPVGEQIKTNCPPYR